MMKTLADYQSSAKSTLCISETAISKIDGGFQVYHFIWNVNLGSVGGRHFS